MTDMDNTLSLDGLDKIKVRETLDEKRTEAINNRLTELTETSFREMDQIRQRSIEESYKITIGS